MLRHPFRMTSVLGLVLALSATALAGCGGDEPTTEDVVPSGDVHNVLVTADSITSLDTGEDLPVDLVDNVVYHFDYSDAPIDYSRVVLVSESGAETPMTESMEAVANWDYGSETKMDLLNAPNHRFQLAMDPLDFGIDLNDAQITELKETGYVYAEKNTPSTQPQTTTDDNCIEADCIICPGGWGTDGSGCYIEHHKWCD